MNMNRTDGAGSTSWRRRESCLLLLLVVITPIYATPPSGGGYVIQREVMAGGGQAVGGGPYALVGTVGQPAATSAVSGGSFQLSSGFHSPRAPALPLPDPLFKNGFE